MRSIWGAVAIGYLCAGSAVRAESDKSWTPEASFRQLTQEWEDAVQARDIVKIGKIEHDDYRNVGPGTLISTKQRDLAVIKSGTVKHVVAQFGPMDVKMLGDDVAVVQGSLTDKSAEGGGADYVFMDVWVKQGGNWSIIRSQSAKVK